MCLIQETRIFPCQQDKPTCPFALSFMTGPVYIPVYISRITCFPEYLGLNPDPGPCALVLSMCKVRSEKHMLPRVQMSLVSLPHFCPSGTSCPQAL